jgi:diguanylate cyclase (GGDEF)-like protein
MLAAAFVVMLWSGLFYDSMRTEEVAIHQARKDVSNLALAYREHISRTVSAIDELLIAIVAEHTRYPDEYRIPEWVEGLPIFREMVVQLALAGPDGIARFSNLGLSGRVDLSDRLHFRHHLNPTGAQPFISVPVLGRVSGKWSIQFTRRLTRNDGSFDGIVILSVDPFYLSKFFDSLDLGKNGTALLAGQDGIVRARGALNNRELGQDISASSLFKTLRLAANGTFVATSPIDGTQRVMGYASVTDYPLVVALGCSIDDILANLHRQKITYAAAAGLGTILIVALAFLFARDSNRRRQRELETNTNERIQKQKLQLDMALTNMSQGLLMFDSSARLVVCNQRYVQMYGLLPEVVKPGCTLQQLVDHSKAVGSFMGDPQKCIDEILAAMAQGNHSSHIVETGNSRIIQIINRPMQDGGWVATHEDITERRQAEAKISHMALHDALTNLPNRLFFREQMENRLAHLGRDEKFAVLCLDLDQFKSVNDTLGHPFGDKLLRQVGERLHDCLREGDTVARLGGDEFAILQGSATQPADTTLLMARLIEVVSKPFNLDGHQVVVGVSIGVTLAPADAADPDQLLKNADMALYRAKAGGRGTYRFFEPEMDARMQARRTLELDLRKAIVHGEFEVYYQPLVNLKTEQISGFEALIRWNHPQRGIVSPLDFIPLAEETGLIVPIGEWVLRQACKEASKWPSNISIAVNLSPVQFKTPNLSQTVVDALAHSGLAADRLQLEITESALLFNSEPTLDTLHQLRALGVHISMDDFGTGYSSLSYLRSFPFDKIKIDRSFIHELSSNEESMAIIRAVAGLGGSLGMSTTGEGIETREELDFLKREGCIEGQGYLFGKPQPAKEVYILLAEQALKVKAAA